MNIKQLYNYNICLLIFKIIRDEVHSELSFKTNAQINRYKTRSADKLQIIYARTKSGQKSIQSEGARLYFFYSSTTCDSTANDVLVYLLVVLSMNGGD